MLFSISKIRHLIVWFVCACMQCGSGRSVAPIKAGFVARVGRRNTGTWFGQLSFHHFWSWWEDFWDPFMYGFMFITHLYGYGRLKPILTGSWICYKILLVVGYMDMDDVEGVNVYFEQALYLLRYMIWHPFYIVEFMVWVCVRIIYVNKCIATVEANSFSAASSLDLLGVVCVQLNWRQPFGPSSMIFSSAQAFLLIVFEGIDSLLIGLERIKVTTSSCSSSGIWHMTFHTTPLETSAGIASIVLYA